MINNATRKLDRKLQLDGKTNATYEYIECCKPSYIVYRVRQVQGYKLYSILTVYCVPFSFQVNINYNLPLITYVLNA